MRMSKDIMCSHIFPNAHKFPVCNKCKTTRSPHRIIHGARPDGLPPPQAFADSVTADHKVLTEDSKARHDQRMALIIADRHTGWTQSYPAPTKSAAETKLAFQRFLGPQIVPKHVYTDGSREFRKAMQDLGYSHDTSTPHHSESNGVAERAVRRVKEGTAVTLTQSGLSEGWWPEAMTCYCFLRNAVDVQRDGTTPYEKRFSISFPGPLIPMGAAVDYKPSSDKDRRRLHEYGQSVLPGIFMGYAQQAGGGWNGD